MAKKKQEVEEAVDEAAPVTEEASPVLEVIRVLRSGISAEALKRQASYLADLLEGKA